MKIPILPAAALISVLALVSISAVAALISSAIPGSVEAVTAASAAIRARIPAVIPSVTIVAAASALPTRAVAVVGTASWKSGFFFLNLL